MNQATIDLYHSLKYYGVGLGYSGIFTDDITENFILFCDDVIINQKNDLKTSKIINFLLCESFQNVVRHANNENFDLDNSFDGYFGLHNLGNDYRLNSINNVNTEDKDKVIKGIESVNNKTRDELSAMYRSKLDKGELSEKGGAGLGIIQMARKSGQNILYKVDDSDSGVERLHQQIMISQLDIPQHTSRIEMCENQFMHMTENNQILQYKGDFSMVRLDCISRILTPNFKCLGDEKTSRNIIFDTLTVLFENAQINGSKINGDDVGTLIVSRIKDSLVLEMGNPILKSITGNFHRLEQIAVEESKFNFQIDSLDENYSFLTVKLEISA